METEVMDKKPSKFPFKFTKKNIIITFLITFILIMLALAAQLSYMTLKFDKIYKGIYINDIYVGGLKINEVKDKLKDKYSDKIKNTELTLSTSKNTEKVNFSDIEVKYDIDGAVDQAYKIGRSGNIFKRLYDIFNTAQKKSYLSLNYTYNPDKLNSVLSSLKNKSLINVKDADLFIQDMDQKVIIRSGHHGENIDIEKVLSQIEENIKNCTGGKITIETIITAPTKINVDDIYNQILRPVADASVKIVNNKLSFNSEVVGREIDKAQLEEIAAELNKSENTEKVLPVKYISPAKTINDIKAQLFKDVLYTKTTTFKTRNQNEVNRSANIRLDTAKINGTVLAPGDVFSYNTVVGRKTPEQGYKDAFTYVAGKQVPGLGGGICQVSSTLYNAVLYADLEVVSRRNHMFEVSYVPIGQDATIYYGSTDFQFRNSTSWPIEILSCVTNDNKVIFTLLGTNENPGKSVKVLSKLVGNVVPFPTRYIDDPTVKKEQIVQIGHPGGTYETYKTVLQDGKVVSTKKITVSYYKPLEQVVKRPPPPVTQPATPTPSSEPIPANPDVVQ